MAKLPSDMTFRIADLPEQRSFTLPEEFVRDALAAIPGQDQLDDPPHPSLHVDVEVSGEPETVFANGHLTGRATIACNRCLGPIELVVNEDFQLTFLPREAAPSDDELTDVDLDDDDLDVAGHDGVEVALGPVLRDHIVLSVPYAPLCSEGCKGLCARCGADLNHTTCSCQSPAETVSPWAALRDLNPKR